MRIGIVDDERPARSELAYLIHSLHPEYELVEADGAEAILSILAEEELAGCFVDINLNDMNGTTLVSMMKRICPELPVVFATAYPNYAVRAFELGAADYILKPFEMDRVQAALERMLRNHPNIQEVCEEPDRTEVSGGEKLEKLMVQGVDSYRIIDVEDIIYIETESRVCHLYTAKEVYTANQSLNYYEKRLAGHKFFRIHKSFLVNLRYMKELIPYYNNGYGLRMKHYEKNILPVGRQQIKVLRQALE